MFDVADKPKRRGRPPKPDADRGHRAGKSYQAYYDGDLWARLEAFMASLPYRTDYKVHIEAALDEYLTRLGFLEDADASEG